MSSQISPLEGEFTTLNCFESEALLFSRIKAAKILIFNYIFFFQNETVV